MKRSSVVMTSIGLLFLSIAVVMNNCGGGGGGDSSPTPTSPPAFNLTGNWQETISNVVDNCGGFQPINDVYTLSQQANSNTVTATNQRTGYVITATMSGDTLTYSGPDFNASGGSCSSVTTNLSLKLTSSSHGDGTSISTCHIATGGSCTVSLSETFNKIP